jgi:integrin-linked kinase-associated serine/threonine phosphatase 2C
MGSLCEKKKDKRKNQVGESGEGVNEDSTSMLIFEANIVGKKKKADLTNQDTTDIITKELGENIKYFAVYDGHGAKGKEASLLIRYEIRRKLVKDKAKIAKFQRKDQVEKYFREMFKYIQKKFDGRSNDYELSGSCAVCVLIIEYKLYCINLGDSRAVLGSKKASKKMALEMSIDHKPTRDDEMKRINERGGEVSDKISGVMRVFKKNDEAPGLAVSRSLGDIVAHECGVISEPEVIEKEIEAEDLFIVIASDGVWDSMSSTEVTGFIMDKMETKKEVACKMLVEECRNRWELLNLYKQRYLVELYTSKDSSESNNKNKENIQNVLDIDDISAVVHFFNYDY